VKLATALCNNKVIAALAEAVLSALGVARF